MDENAQIEHLLIELAKICQDAGVSGYDQVMISLGLIHVAMGFEHNDDLQFRAELLNKQAIDKYLIIRHYSTKVLGQENSQSYASRHFFASLEKLSLRILNRLVHTLFQLDYKKISHRAVFYVAKVFISRLSSSGKFDGYYTSNFQLGELLRLIVPIKPGDRVYDPAAGLGIILSFLELRRTAHVVFQDVNESIIALAEMLWNFAPESVNTVFVRNDSLIRPAVQEGSIDLIVSELPFGKLRLKDKSYFDPNIVLPSSNLSELFIQIVMSRLSSKGKAYLLIPDGFLFSRSRSTTEIKKNLISKDLIEAIISFPHGFLKPYSGVKTSLLILNCKKAHSRQGNVLFIEAEEQQVDDPMPKIDPLQIANVFLDENIRKPEIAIRVGNSEIVEDDFDLQTKRYLGKQQFEALSKVDANQVLVKLKEILSPIRTIKNKFENIPYVKVGDLANDPFQANLPFKSWGAIDEKFSGNLLEESALLVARVGEKLKPSFFEYRNTPIALNSNIYAFRFDSKEIDRDYLIFELSSEFFEQQLHPIRSGTAYSSWTKRDFLELCIKLPKLGQRKLNLEEQQKIARRKKELLIAEKNQELEDLKERLQIGGNGLEILSNFKHDFMGNLEQISSGLLVLRKFLEVKDRQEKLLKMSDPISNFTAGKTPPETLNDWMHRLESNVKNAITTLENEIEEIKKDKQTYYFQTTNLFHFLTTLKKEHTPAPQGPRYRISIEKGLNVEDIGQLYASIDKRKFKIIFDNLISNAVNHGFNKDQRKLYNIVFELDLVFENEISYILIRYENDGSPFPRGFTFKDFIQRGRKAGKNANSGIGGDRINRIVQRHNGIFREDTMSRVLEQTIPLYRIARELVPAYVRFEILIPQSL